MRPAWPATAKRSAILQRGETCSTTKATRAALGSPKVKVVTRRRFGPLVAIQLREERKRKRSTVGRSERGAEDADDGEAVEDEEPPELPPGAAPEPAGID